MTPRPGAAPGTGARHPSSFRDPSGHLFVSGGDLLRRVNHSFRQHYDRMVESGFARAATEAGLLIAHEEVGGLADGEAAGAYRVLRPERVPFVSYPYEWCFAQLRDAALLTLRLQKRALDFGLTLKDASAYNVQFLRGKPVFIDSLSFEVYEPGRPWIAYQQFCQHFLAPLALMARRHPDLSQLLRIYVDGVPLAVASALLPLRTWLSPALATHVHAHARMIRRHGSSGDVRRSAGTLSQTSLLGLVDHLESAVRALEWRGDGTEWGDYYADTNYSAAARGHKLEVVGETIAQLAPATVWDLGANTGVFGRLAAERGIPTVALDGDPAAVQQSYLAARERGDANLLPLLMDLTNPSPDLGWDGTERDSLRARGPADLVLALALLHHLAIRHNVPFDRQATFLRHLGRRVLVEFVDRDDSQVQRLLAHRASPLEGYDRDTFERAMGAEFVVERRDDLRNARRSLYLLAAR